MNSFGLIQIYFGEGKGKTTDSLGQAIRAFGNGKKVAFVFFDKGGEDYNERKVLEKLNIPYFSFGRNRRRDNGTFDFTVIEKDIEMAKKSMEKLIEIQNDCDLIVLDEVLNAIKLKMIDESVIIDYLKNKKPNNLELILTGQTISKELLSIADLVTEMKLHKHYMYNGVPAREGVEW